MDTPTWIAVGVATGAVALTLVVLVVVLVLFARGTRTARPPGEEALEASSARFEAMMAELTAALERSQEESRRSRELSAVRESLDLDAVLARTLDFAAGLQDVDAAMIVLRSSAANDGEKPLIATVGLSTEEAAGLPVGPPSADRPSRAVLMSYRYPAGADGDSRLLRGGLAVPLVGPDEEPVGTLAALWRSPREVSDDQIRVVEELAASAGPAIENARRFREARQLADLDALTGLHNRRFFHETLEREVARAHRYGRRLALVVFDVDDFKSINDRVGHLAGDGILADVGERVRSVVRGADVACRVGGDEFAVILPESTLHDSEQLYRRLQFAIVSRPTGASDRLLLSAGIAELRDGDDSVSFFERADEALYRAKEAGKGQAIAADGNRAS